MNTQSDYTYQIEIDYVELRNGREGSAYLTVEGKLIYDEIDAEPEPERIRYVEDLEFYGRIIFDDGSFRDVADAKTFRDILTEASYNACEERAEEWIADE